MSQLHTFQEVHAEICKSLDLDPDKVHYCHCSVRPGHGRIEPLDHKQLKEEIIFRYVNESSYLRIYEDSRTLGGLHLHEKSLWFDASTNTQLEDQPIIELDDYEPWVPTK